MEIIIPNYPIEVVLSQKQRAKYFKRNIHGVFTENGKQKGKELFKKYLKDKNVAAIYNNLNDDVELDRVEQRLINSKTKEPIISNPSKSGTPRTEYINFNKIWAGGQSMVFYRNKAEEQINQYCADYFVDIPPINRKLYPLHIIIEIHSPVKGNGNKDWNTQTWDDFNLYAIYHKVLCDMLVKNNIIIDDDRMYCRTTPVFIPLPDNNDVRKIVISISSLTDARVINNKYYKEFYNEFKKFVP